MILIYPSIDELLTKVDSRYSLVILAAKRARQLRDFQGHGAEGTASGPEGASLKEVTAALEEIDAGKITYERTKDGIK